MNSKNAVTQDFRAVKVEDDGTVEIDGIAITRTTGEDTEIGGWSFVADLYIDPDEGFGAGLDVQGDDPTPTEYVEAFGRQHGVKAEMVAEINEYNGMTTARFIGSWSAIKDAMIAYDGSNMSADEIAFLRTLPEPTN